MFLLRILGILWSAPLTVAGLIAALLGGATFHQFHGNAIEFVAPGRGFLTWFFRKYRFAAFTWGGTIIYAHNGWATNFPRLRVHEHRHVWQCMIMGPTAPIVYGLASLFAVVTGKKGYRDNFLERDARRHAGQE